MSNHLWFLIPEAILLAGVVAVAITGLVRNPSIRRLTPSLAGIFIVASGVASIFVFDPSRTVAVDFIIPGLGRWIGAIAAGVGLFLVMNSVGLVDRRLEREVAAGRQRFDPLRAGRGEYYAFMLLSLAGMMLVCTARDLIWLFLALELTSLPTYVMVAMSRNSRRGEEAAMKYFFLGAMSAAVFLYGFALIYAATGTVEFQPMRDILRAQVADGGLGSLPIAGLILALFGISYKLAAAPLHLYAADVYEGAAAPVTAFLGFVPKAAGALALMVLLSASGLSETMSTLPYPLLIMFWVMAVLTMTLGNIGALLQRSTKRMLAYSSIAHSGYLLIGIIAGPGLGYAAVLFYLLSYGIGNTAAFSVIASLERDGRELESMDDLAGLRQRHPLQAVVMAVASGSLLGFPPLLGFWGKLLLFVAGIQTGHYLLVIIAAVNSAISGWYYLKLIAIPIMAKPTARSESVHRRETPWPRYAGVVLAAGTIMLPIFLTWLVDRSTAAARIETPPAVNETADGEADSGALPPSGTVGDRSLNRDAEG